MREILWSLQRFLRPQSAVDTKGAVHSFSGLCLCGTPRKEPHSAGQCAKWVAWSEEHQETIKFGGLSASRGACWGVGWLWFTLKLRRRNEKLLFTFQTDCSLYFHPHPNTSKGRELWKMRLSNGRGNVKQSSEPLWFTSQDCRSDSRTFATTMYTQHGLKVLQYLNVILVTLIFFL